jgi:hypothetical protein
MVASDCEPACGYLAKDDSRVGWKMEVLRLSRMTSLICLFYGDRVGPLVILSAMNQNPLKSS